MLFRYFGNEFLVFSKFWYGWLVDQLNHADLAVGVHAFVVPTTLVEVPVAVHPGWQLAAQAAGFLARGPPVQS